MIPTKDLHQSKKFWEGVFRWKIVAQPGTTSRDILPNSGKGVSAELNSDETVIVPSICIVDIDIVLEKIKLGGKVVVEKTSISEMDYQGHYALLQEIMDNWDYH